MKKYFIGVILFVASNSTVHAASTYVGGKYMMYSASIENPFISLDSSPTGFAVVAGESLTTNFAVEGTLLLSGGEASISSSSYKLKMNSFVDVTAVAKTRLSPEFELAGRGGIALVKWKDSAGDTASVTGLTLAGVASYYINNDFRIFVEYQFLPDAEYDDFPDVKVAASSFNLGATIRF